MNFTLFSKRLALVVAISSVGHVLHAAEMDNTERIYQTTFGVLSIEVIKHKTAVNLSSVWSQSI
jgi:hypothetical protein